MCSGFHLDIDIHVITFLVFCLINHISFLPLPPSLPSSSSCSELLPNHRRDDVKQTSPRHNAYPTWAEEFVFSNLSPVDVTQAGLEVTLYDHHRFKSNENVGGVRLSVPVKAPPPGSPVLLHSGNASPVISHSYSPSEIQLNGEKYVIRW